MRRTPLALIVSTAASDAQALQGEQYNGKMTWKDIAALAKSAAKPDEYGLRAEILELVDTAKSLSAKPKAE